MQEPAKGRDLGWRSVWKMFLPWTVSVYALSALTIDLVLPSQGVLGERGFHLTFLIPAVCVGSIGTVVLTDRAPQTRLGRSFRLVACPGESAQQPIPYGGPKSATVPPSVSEERKS